MVVRLWARISGSIGRIFPAPSFRTPVNTARPNAAEIPQNSVASAMNMYPRKIGWPGLAPNFGVSFGMRAVDISLTECLLDALGVKPY